VRTQCCRCPYPGSCLGWGELQGAGQQHLQVGEAVLTGQIAGLRLGDQLVVDERQPVPEGFEPLPKADLLRRTELIKTASLNSVDQTIERIVEGVQGLIKLGAFRALTC